MSVSSASRGKATADKSAKVKSVMRRENTIKYRIC